MRRIAPWVARAYVGDVHALRIILTLIGALAVLLLGPVTATASATAAPACHDLSIPVDHGSEDAAHQGSSHDTSSHDQKPMKPMGCCAGCVTPPMYQPRAATTPSLSATLIRPAVADMPRGLSPSPEHGPPRG